MALVALKRRRYLDFIRAARRVRGQMTAEVMAATDGVVQHGPLKGLHLGGGSTWGSDSVGQIFGLYEQQLFPYLTGHKHAVFVDVGAADGVWAVGLVKAGHFDRCVCFEQRPKGRQTIRKRARQNGVAERIDIRGAAETADLVALAGELTDSNPVFLIDIEGAEFDMLTPEFFAAARNATIVIELHPWASDRPDPVADLVAAAGDGFTIARVDDSVRDMSGLLDQTEMHDLLRYTLVSEDRSRAQKWLALTPA